MFCEKKKSKCPKKERKKNFSKCGEGGKNVSVEFRVFGKKRKLKEKFREKKSKFFFGENFAKFVFTGWVFSVKRKCFSSSRRKSFECVLPR